MSTQDDLRKLLRTFNDKRVITEGEIKVVFASIVSILAENKKGVDSLNSETKKIVQDTLNQIIADHNAFIQSIKSDLTKNKSDIELATKQQNDRAFKRLQDLIASIRLPKDGLPGEPGKDGIGLPGKDGSPDTAIQVRDKLESLKDEDRLDASAIKNLPQFVKQKAKEMLVGGIRFFENLADVSIVITKKRNNLLAQYKTTNKRWEDGVALTISLTQPTDPQEGDLWVDIN